MSLKFTEEKKPFKLASLHPLLMAPRRNNSGPSMLDVPNLFGFDTNHQFDTNHDLLADLMEPNMIRCCIPNTDCLKTTDFGLINLDLDLADCVRVVCNNDACSCGNYMHRECFEAWEQMILTCLKSIGRARSWSDKQRQQNLWTKKGYDLIYKACNCKCGRGHLKKDLDWTAPASPQNAGGIGNVSNEINETDDGSKKKKKRNRNNQKPILSIGIGQTNNNNNYHSSTNNQATKMPGLELAGLMETTSIRGRANSLGSSNGSSSPPASSSEQSISPVHNSNSICKTINSNNNNNNNTNTITSKITQEIQRPLTPRTLTEIYSERVR